MTERDALDRVFSHIQTDGADFISLDRALRDYRTAVLDATDADEFRAMRLRDAEEDFATALADANALQGEVDELRDWQRRVCELLTPEGDRGTLFPELAEARINELLRIERTAPARVIRAARAV